MASDFAEQASASPQPHTRLRAFAAELSRMLRRHHKLVDELGIADAAGDDARAVELREELDLIHRRRQEIEVHLDLIEDCLGG